MKFKTAIAAAFAVALLGAGKFPMKAGDLSMSSIYCLVKSFEPAYVPFVYVG